MLPALTTVTFFKHGSMFACCACIMLSCNASPKAAPETAGKKTTVTTTCSPIIYNNKYKVIHVFVALCDNLHQGIEPVPRGIGNGQDPATNLYWGCDYGVKAWFKNKAAWKLVSTIANPAQHILERCIFKDPSTGAYMVADAYDGAYIKQTMADFLNAMAGVTAATIVTGHDTLGIDGNAALVAYVGHEGLMDVSLDSFPAQHDVRKRDAVILACESKQYWYRIMQKSGANPLLWTTELMCPEAYTLHAAITGWLNKETPQQIHLLASAAYSKYQNCSVKTASNLLATGY